MSNTGRLSVSDVELRYPSQSQERAKYFSIKEDRGTRRVRFLYNDLNDVYFDVVHEVRVNNKTTQIKCLNSMGDNLEGCPLCSKGHYQKVVLYIPVLDVDTNEILIWSRSKAWLQQIQGLMARNNPLSGTVFEIMRIGAPRDMKTQYIPQPITMNDGKTVQQILGELQANFPAEDSYMKIMNYNEMLQYANNLDSVQGNVPANRGGYSQTPNYPNQGYAQPQNSGYNTGYNTGYNPQNYGNTQNYGQSYNPPQPQVVQNNPGYPQAPGGYAETNPMTPPGNMGRSVGEPVRRVPQYMPNPNVNNAAGPNTPDDDELPF